MLLCSPNRFRGGVGEPLFISVVGDGIEWTLGGSDAAHFSIDSPSGALRFDLDPVAPVIVVKAPDFEAPANSDTDKAYVVTLLPFVRIGHGCFCVECDGDGV